MPPTARGSGLSRVYPIGCNLLQSQRCQVITKQAVAVAVVRKSQLSHVLLLHHLPLPVKCTNGFLTCNTRVLEL